MGHMFLTIFAEVAGFPGGQVTILAALQVDTHFLSDKYLEEVHGLTTLGDIDLVVIVAHLDSLLCLLRKKILPEESIFCNRNAAMPKNATEGINVHTVHQTAFGKVIPQCMRGIGLIDACSAKIFPESGFKCNSRSPV